MDFKLVLLAIVALPALAAAQSRGHSANYDKTLPAPLPQIGLRLPQIGLPLPPIGVPTVEGGRHARPVRVPENGRPRRFGHRVNAATVVYAVPFYSWYVPYFEAPSPAGREDFPTRQVEPPATGRLKLDVQPLDEAEVYVDGSYAGVPADFASGLELEAGSHGVEIRASGYETLRFDVNVVPGRSITYRRTLTPAAANRPVGPALPAGDVAAPAVPMTYYVIPGCYVGNVPPQDARLPTGCDHTRTITVKP
jgi:hypothetical protein